MHNMLIVAILHIRSFSFSRMPCVLLSKLDDGVAVWSVGELGLLNSWRMLCTC
jgi:hypothetical protein